MDTDLLPATTADQEAIRDLYQLTRPPVDDDSRALVAGLVEDSLVPEVAALLPPVPGRSRVAAGYVHGLIRAVIGSGLADELGIPPSRVVGALTALGDLAAAGLGTIERLPGGTARRVARGRRYRAEQERRLRARYGMTHELVDTAPATQHPARV